MVYKSKQKWIIALLAFVMVFCVACRAKIDSEAEGKYEAIENQQQAVESENSIEESTETEDDLESEASINGTADDNANEDSKEEQKPISDIAEPTDEEVDSVDSKADDESKVIDLILFMGQSNMSGCGGDATLAPKVKDGAGYEFRAISDPTKLYPITEPFGANENYIGGIMEKPGGKKGSLVSAFINEYYELTGVPVIAVSASLGETTLSDWNSPNMKDDAVLRFVSANSWLNNNGYSVRKSYMVWLQGESDALEGTSADAYRTQFDDFIRPFFQDGLQKVFVITPGRTIDATEIYSRIIKAQKSICKESGYYCLASTVLSGISTEYMTDLYHYNQHVLNLVGEDAARCVAYYTNTGNEKVIYDYKEKTYFYPDGSEDLFRDADPILDLTDINNKY